MQNEACEKQIQEDIQIQKLQENEEAMNKVQPYD